jgi:hypothetical protein
MNPTVPMPHAGHDELLIARLFGGDVSEAERALALDQMAECEDCAALFADLAVIAEATAALPTPGRPRDFTLTEADAARLAQRARGRRVFGLGLRRSLGGAVAALGIVGMVAAGTGSFISQAATSGYTSQVDHAAAAPGVGGIAATSAGAGSKSGPVAAPTAAPAAAATAGPGQSGTTTTLTAPTIVARATKDTELVPAPSASDSQFALATPGPETNTTGSTPRGSTAGPDLPAGAGTGPASGWQGPDARLLLMLGFAALFLAGLAIAILPGRRSGRTRGA